MINWASNEIFILIPQALNKHQDTFRKQQKSGIHHEDTFLQEAATREESYKSTLIEYETELKTCKQALERFSSENERLNSALLECQQHNDSLEEQRRQIKNEIREYKIRENRNLADYAELEDENIMLQKQVSQLKQSQVEFEGRWMAWCGVNCWIAAAVFCFLRGGYWL